MTKCLREFGNDESGATAIEYGLIASGIAIALIATIGPLGNTLNFLFSDVSTLLDAKLE